MKPMIPEIAEEIVGRFGILKFFPSSPDTRLQIVDLLMNICPSAEAARWLCDRVVAKWREWEGPAALRELLSEKFKPADQAPASSDYDSRPPLLYEIVTARDGTEGVRLVRGAAPLSLPAPAEADSFKSESIALVKTLASGTHKVPCASRIDSAPLPPDPLCTRCQGSGWLLESELRCACTFRRLLAKRKSLVEVEGELATAVGMTPRRSEQENEAMLIDLKVNTGIREPGDPPGTYKETPMGAEPFLVQ